MTYHCPSRHAGCYIIGANYMNELSKKERDKLSRAMRKAGLTTVIKTTVKGKVVYKPNPLATDLDRAKLRELKRSLLTPKQLRDAANVHIGNKLLKPDSGFYKPDGHTRTMPSLKAGKLQATQYKVAKPKKQKGAGIYKRNPLD